MDSKIVVSLVHTCVTGPFLLFVGLSEPKEKVYYYIVVSLSVVLLLSFIFRAVTKKIEPWTLVHTLLFLPLLLTISLFGLFSSNVPKILFSFLVAVSCAALGYHVIKIIRFLISLKSS